MNGDFYLKTTFHENTESYDKFYHGTSERRKDLNLCRRNENRYLFPPHGTPWDPSSAEETIHDAFILFFVAELESYLESIIEIFLEKYDVVYKTYFLRHCQAGEKYIDNVSKKISSLKSSHGIGWKTLGNLLSFVGIKKSSFPQNYWDNIDVISRHRGSIAHTGGGYLRTVRDRREYIIMVERIIEDTDKFDQKVYKWIKSVDIEIDRLPSLGDLYFKPTYP